MPSLILKLALLLTIAAMPAAFGQSTNWITSATLETPYGLASDSDTVDQNATLTVQTSLLAGNLNVGPLVGGTLTLNTGGSITVQTLLCTNEVIGGAKNSTFNFNGGTLITSNAANAVAASILLASNTPANVNGNWTMNGGTNFFVAAQTNGTWSRLVIGNGVNNVSAIVNSNAVLSLVNPAISSSNMYLEVGYGNATNNLLLITNGGQLLLGNNPNGSGAGLNVGNNAGSTGNGIIVTGTNSMINMGVGLRINLGSSGANTYNINNFIKVDQDAIITNVDLFNIYGVNNTLYITNGGQVYLNSAGGMPGRTGSNNVMYVAGADGAGNPATLNLGVENLDIGGDGNNTIGGTNCGVWVGQGGLVTNCGGVYVGYGGGTNGAGGYFSSTGNFVVVTNGGQVFSSANGSYTYIGYYTNANSNYVLVGGAFGTTNATWNFGGHSLVIGGNACASNNYLTLLAGGVLTNVSVVTLGGVSNNLYFNGGTLAACQSGILMQTNATAVNCFAYVQGGGVIIDSSNGTVTCAVPLTQDPNNPGGGLTKRGSGTLILTNVDTYTGNTLISNGVLEVENPSALGGGTVVVSMNSSSSTGGELQLYGGITLANPITITGSVAASPTGVINNPYSGGTNTLTGSILLSNLGATCTFGGAASGPNGSALNINGGIVQSNSTQILQFAGSSPTFVNSVINLNGGQMGAQNGGPNGPVVLNVAGTNLGAAYMSFNGCFKLGLNNPLGTNKNLTLGANSSSANPDVGTFDLAGFNQTVNALIGVMNSNGGSTTTTNPSYLRLVTNSVPASPGTLTVGNGNGSGTNDGLIAGNVALTKVGTGTEILTGSVTNTYTGATLISAGTLALTSNAWLGASASISVAGGAMFDVSGLANAFTLSSGQTLSNAAAATGLVRGNLNVGAGAVAVSYNGVTPALAVTNGTLALASGSTFIINNTGSQLPAGNYMIIANLTGGAVAGPVPSSVTVAGAGTAGNNSLSISNSDLYLVVASSVNTDPATANFQGVVADGALNFSWASDHQGWQLYTNAVGLTAPGSWFPVPGSANVTSTNITINPAAPSVFFQLRYP